MESFASAGDGKSCMSCVHVDAGRGSSGVTEKEDKIIKT